MHHCMKQTIRKNTTPTSMLPVLERFGGKPVRCLLDDAQEQGVAEGTHSRGQPPAYIWDFARMREQGSSSASTKPLSSRLMAVPVVAAAPVQSHRTPVVQVQGGEEEDASLIPQASHEGVLLPTALALLAPVTTTEEEEEEEGEGEGEDDDLDGAWAARDCPAYLQERRHRFSRAPLRHLQMAGALGLINLVGAMWLLDQWRAFPPPASTALYLISRALALYAWAFLLLPLLRLALIARWNRAVSRRNAMRRFRLDEFKAQSTDAGSAVYKKLEWAARYRAHVAGGAGVRL